MNYTQNFVISNVEILRSDDGTMTFSHNFQIKLIDFGLAEVFGSIRYPENKQDFLSSKYCGKLTYESPEIYTKKKAFNAQKSDIWSLGICFFLMLVGREPYDKPVYSDQHFALIVGGKLSKLLNETNKMKYVDTESIDLLAKLLKFEKDRANIGDICNHSWFSS